MDDTHQGLFPIEDNKKNLFLKDMDEVPLKVL
jgi:hypothetical protein